MKIQTNMKQFINPHIGVQCAKLINAAMLLEFHDPQAVLRLAIKKKTVSLYNQ